jgi:cullin 3
VRHYLNLSTEPKLKRIVETELITTHAKALVDMEHSGVVAMLVDSKVGDLRRMYDLLTRVPSTLDVLRNCVCDYVKKVGVVKRLVLCFLSSV